jgi:hypothetical protein
MRVARAVLTILVATASRAYGGHTTYLPIPADSPLSQVANRAFAEVTTLGAIDPAAVTAVVARLRYDPRLADAGAPWEATDVGLTDAPCRRLLVAGHLGSSWVLLYEHGGRGLHHHLVMLQVADGTAVVEYWGTGYACKSWRQCESGKCRLRQLQEAVRKGWFGPNEWGSDADN